MSEEEIIIDAKEFINNIKEILNEDNNDLTKKVETDFYTLQVVLQGLLDLYNKEKEKNKRIKDGTLIVGRRNGKSQELNVILEEYISKDKIRAKIEELEKDMVLSETRAILKELLEE